RKRAGSDNGVDVETNQLVRQARESLEPSIGVSKLDTDVLALDVTEIPKPLLEGLVDRVGARIGARQYPDPRYLRRLLRLRGERRGEETASKGPEERTPVDHWITSSARSRRDWGMVRPRALAVFRLTTRSNLVGLSTGYCAGLAPWRILSAISAARRNIARILAP